MKHTTTLHTLQLLSSRMGLFDNLQKKGSKALQGQPMTIRKEAVKVSIDPSQSPSPMVHSRTPPPGNKPLLSVTNDSKTDFTGKHARSDRSSSKKRSWSPQPRFDSSDSNEDQSSIDGTQRKRIKPSSGVEIDQSRRIGCETAFDDVEDQDGRIHAASLTSGINGAKYAEAFPTLAPSSELLLRFPSALHAERYIQSPPRLILAEHTQVCLDVFNASRGVCAFG